MKTKLLLIAFFLFAQASFSQFITTWQTLSENQTITIPVNPNFTYDYTVDWGDGTTSTNQTTDASHTYATRGIYTVSITGTFPAIFINYSRSRSNLKSVVQWGNNPWASMERAFDGCTFF